MPQNELYEFGPYRIDVALSRLERAGAPIPLPPKAFDLLLVLARNHDRVMGKSELMEALWPKTFVEDANLTQHVYTLRKALGDQPNGQPYIETAARRGYRLAADVRRLDTPRRAPQPGTTAVILEGERKPATVVHCTLANAAGVIERLGPSRMHDLMHQLMTLANEEVTRYEGVISERHADGLVAVFGAPIVHEDDGRRAILAALAIQRRFRHLLAAGRPDEERLDLQMGINTGPLVISRLSGDPYVEYTAVGETMRMAGLLQQFAEPGAILLSETTRRAVERYVSVDPVAAPWPAGGHAYRVTALMRDPQNSIRLARAWSPLVGRQHEIALLQRLFAQAAEAHGQVLNLVGEPGMGKSRLAGELTRLAAGPATTLEGRCVSYGSLVPYLPIAELVRAYCGIDESDPPDVIRRAVEGVIAEHGLPADAPLCLLRLLGIVDSASALVTVSPEAIKARTFDVLRLLLLKPASRQPLVIVVEDVHWIDSMSEEFLTTLVERLIGTRVMLVATHRPGYRAPWMDRSYVTHITLSPLTAADSARLVESVTRDRPLDPAVSSAILNRGEGNPFFLEELARTVVEHGPATDAIPETVQGVIMARIDRLAETPKQLLQTASVLGREVPLGLLRRVWSGPANFDAELVELRRLEFLYERTAGEEPSYVFKHALTQDVAYDSLLARSRRDLHLRAARALEELYPDRLDDLASTLAYHYVRTDLADEAVKWLARAADRAARVYANAEAILHLDLAARRLQRLPEGPGRDRGMLEVALQQAHSLYFLGRFRESVDVLLPHEARLVRLNDRALAAAYSFWLAHMYSRLGDQRRAADNARRAIDAASAAGDDATRGKAHGLLSLEGHWAGRPDEGLQHGATAIRLLAKHPDQRWWLGMAHFYVAMNHLLKGGFNAAQAEAARADAVGKEIGDPRLPTYAGYIVGWAEAARGNHEAAIAACRQSLERAPDRVSRAYASLFLGYALLEQGAHEAARAHLEPVVAELEGFAFPQWHGLAVTLTGESLRLLGQLDRAAPLVERGLQVATRASYWYAIGVAHRVAGRIARDRGDLAAASRALQQALKVFERSHAAFEATRTRLDLAAVAIARQDPDRAREELAAAIAGFEALHEAPSVQRAAALAAGLARTQPSS